MLNLNLHFPRRGFEGEQLGHFFVRVLVNLYLRTDVEGLLCYPPQRVVEKSLPGYCVDVFEFEQEAS